jgi:hypothetical protein
MAGSKKVRPPGLLKISYDKDTAEFNRVINLSDAVFAIAMTRWYLPLTFQMSRGRGLLEPRPIS